MTEALQFFREGLMLAVWLSTPPLLVAVVAGVLLSLLQTLLSVQDQTPSFVAKLVAVTLALSLIGRWIGLEVLDLAERAFLSVPSIVNRGVSLP